MEEVARVSKQNPLFPVPPASLSAGTYALFTSLCTVLPPEGLDALLGQVDNHLRLIHAHQRSNEFLAVDLADAVAAGIRRLLAEYALYGSREQQLIVGAARYFVHAEDSEHDVDSILGLDDDVLVFNYVTEQLGMPQHRIEL